MRYFQLTVISVCAAVGLSSCSLFQRTATTHTARTIEIETDIQQMPTVADLVVDTVYVREDTTWTNISFKYTMPKAEMRKVLLGEMMEKANADVIVQPREKVTNGIYHPFKQTYTMEVWGYPARYRNFRTATEEDIRILNGIDPQPTNYNTIYINGGGNYSPRPISGQSTRSITPAKLNKPKKPGYQRDSYIGNIEIGYNYLPTGGAMCHGFVINTTHLWRTKNPHVYQGFGMGLNAGFSSAYRSNAYSSYTELNQEYLIPIYYSPRFYFSRTRVAPYLDLRAGAFLEVGGIKDTYTNNNSVESWVGAGGGFYAAGFFGIAFGRHFDFSFGTDQFVGYALMRDNNFNSGNFYYNLSAAVKLAYCF